MTLLHLLMLRLNRVMNQMTNFIMKRGAGWLLLGMAVMVGCPAPLSAAVSAAAPLAVNLSPAPAWVIKGVLLDSLTREGEPYATIRVVRKEAPDKVVKMAVTGANGRFSEKLTGPAGVYVLTISSIGKEPLVREAVFSASCREVDLGILLSREATNELKGVEVVAQKPLVTVEVDKIEYNIGDDPDAKSNTILEMLRKVPMVTVDGEDNVQVNGSSSFKIHVNGKPNNMMSNNPKEVLKSMPAATIKYIEVITAPGAKYDAEGVGGILNIVTVGGGFEGYTATFRGEATNEGGGVSSYAMFQQGKLTLSVNYNANFSKSPRNYSDSYRENYDAGALDEKFLESVGSSRTKGNFQHGNLEASYEVDSLRLLTLALGMYGGANRGNTDGQTWMYGANHQDVAYRYRTDNWSKGSWYNITGNVDYQRTSRKNKARLLTLSYKIDTQPNTDEGYRKYLDLFSEEPLEELVDRLSLQNQHTDGRMNTMEHTAQMDFTTPIGKQHTVEVGAKYIFRRNSSDNAVFEAAGGSEAYVYNEQRSSEYRHVNHILSAYAGYTWKYKAFSLKPGIRYEQTLQRVKYLVGPGENFHSDFSDWVPSVALGWKLSDAQNLRASYNMRIWRPSIWDLNPYFNNQDPMFISQGNPNLKSEKNHAVDLTYSFFTAKFNLNLSLRHQFTNNSIERISRIITAPEGEDFGNGHVAPQGALYATSANVGKNRETGLSVFANWNATSRTRIYLNGRLNYQDMESEAQGLHNAGWNMFCHGGIQHTLPWKLRVSLNAGGMTPRKGLQGKRTGFRYYSFSLSRSFLKDDRLSVNMYCNNVFEKYRTFSNETVGTNFFSKTNNRYPSRRFGIGVSYRIGDLKAKVKKTARSIENDDVKGGGQEGDATGR